MKLLRTIALACIAQLLAHTGSSQNVALGQWKDYLSFTQGVTVSQGNGIMYCVAGSAVFSYNTHDNSIQKYTKVNGLSDVGPSVARFCAATNSLVIGYPNGNIDIVQNNGVVNIPELKTANVQGQKMINNIYFNGTNAYLSCGQGIIQVDLTQDIISNTYYIGPAGSALNVFNITIFNDTIFAATANGIYKVSYNDPNLNDYTHWKQVVGPIPSTKKAFGCITTVGDTVFTNYSNNLTTGSGGYDTLYTYNRGQWKKFYILGTDVVRSLQTCTVKDSNYLVMSLLYNARILSPHGVVVNQAGSYSFGAGTPVDALIDGNMNFWIADAAYGLVETNGSPTAGIAYDPPGPFSNDVTSIAVASNGNIWITPGGYTAAYSPDYLHNVGISTFQNGTWNKILVTPKDTLYDLWYATIDPHNPYHAFISSWGHGLVEYNNTSITKVWNTGNSTIQNCGGCSAINYYSARVGGNAYDTLGNLWMTNSITQGQYLSVKEANGTWQGFDFSSFLNQGTIVVQLLVTQSDAKWMVVPGTGIMAYQDNSTFAKPSSSNTEIINSTVHHGGLPSLNVYAIAEDKNGSIWVGTDQSVVVFYSPDNVFDGNGDWDASPVYVQQNGYTQYLMQNQVTNAIAIDGANRKWIGTQGGGVFLMSSDGTQQILNFTTANSPLISNNIECIAINPTTGEVFFGTDKGIVSYKGDATEGNLQYTNVYTYPNPVPHGYDGPVAITGLVTNSDVKITTINGEIVYHTTALGGQAIWNGTNFDGKRVQTGVYLVFCNSPDGSQTHVTKLLFIN